VRWYIGGVKVKTSVTLSEDLVDEVDEVAGGKGNRSKFIESVLRRHLRQRRRDENFSREVEILNAIAEGRLGEAPDVFDYTAPITYERED